MSHGCEGVDEIELQSLKGKPRPWLKIKRDYAMIFHISFTKRDMILLTL